MYLVRVGYFDPDLQRDDPLDSSPGYGHSQRDASYRSLMLDRGEIRDAFGRPFS
jgi:hypothetical protein